MAAKFAYLALLLFPASHELLHGSKTGNTARSAQTLNHYSPSMRALMT